MPPKLLFDNPQPAPLDGRESRYILL